MVVPRVVRSPGPTLKVPSPVLLQWTGSAPSAGAEAGDVDAVGDHEGAVEADAELTDEVEVGLLAALLLGAGLLQELQGARVGDRAEVERDLVAASCPTPVSSMVRTPRP